MLFKVPTAKQGKITQHTVTLHETHPSLHVVQDTKSQKPCQRTSAAAEQLNWSWRSWPVSAIRPQNWPTAWRARTISNYTMTAWCRRSWKQLSSELRPLMSGYLWHLRSRLLSISLNGAYADLAEGECQLSTGAPASPQADLKYCSCYPGSVGGHIHHVGNQGKALNPCP